MAIKRIKSLGDFGKDSKKLFELRPNELTDDEVKAREKVAADAAMKPMDTSYIDHPFGKNETIDFAVVPDPTKDIKPQDMIAKSDGGIEPKASAKTEAKAKADAKADAKATSLEVGKNGN